MRDCRSPNILSAPGLNDFAAFFPNCPSSREPARDCCATRFASTARVPHDNRSCARGSAPSFRMFVVELGPTPFGTYATSIASLFSDCRSVRRGPRPKRDGPTDRRERGPSYRVWTLYAFLEQLDMRASAVITPSRTSAVSHSWSTDQSIQPDHSQYTDSQCSLAASGRVRRAFRLPTAGITRSSAMLLCVPFAPDAGRFVRAMSCRVLGGRWSTSVDSAEAARASGPPRSPESGLRTQMTDQPFIRLVRAAESHDMRYAFELLQPVRSRTGSDRHPTACADRVVHDRGLRCVMEPR